MRSVARHVVVAGLFGACATQVGALQAKAPVLECSPRVVGAKDNVVLTMSVPHPAELAVRHPDGTSFFLVYEVSEGLPEGRTPIYSKPVFRNLREMRLSVEQAKGTPWVAGRESNERIFTQAGDYEFILTDVLETDANYPTYRCKVRYRPGQSK